MAMAIVSVGDLLDRAATFEQELEEYYTVIRDVGTNEGAKLLTYHLSKHRRHLQEALSDFNDDKIALIRSIKLKYDIEFKLKIDKADPEDIKGQDLLEGASNYDAELIHLYKEIIQQPLSPEAITLFETLIRIEERDIVMIKKIIAMNYF
jgi:hypothetical protein